MANASVLLHVGQRKKVVKIPFNCSGHYAFLCARVVEWTGEAVDYFEKYDVEWDDWIELEQGFEVHDRDRVRAVVSTSGPENQHLERIPSDASTSKVSKC